MPRSITLPVDQKTTGRKVFYLEPGRNLIVIDGFDVRYDVLDLSSYYPSLQNISHISFSSHPLQLFPSEGQAIQFPSIETIRLLSERNFQFYAVSTSNETHESKTSVIFGVISLAVLLTIIVFICIPIIMEKTTGDDKMDFTPAMIRKTTVKTTRKTVTTITKSPEIIKKRLVLMN
jgi:hypothetical protein